MNLKNIAYSFLLLALHVAGHASPILHGSGLTVAQNAPKSNDLEDLFFLTEEEEIFVDNDKVNNPFIERLKAHLLSGLGLKEVPTNIPPPPPVQTFRFRGSSWYNKGVTNFKELGNNYRSEFLTSEIVPNTCFDRSGPPCLRLHIEVPSAYQGHPIPSELWLFKKEGVTEFTISQLIDEPHHLHLQRVLFHVRNQTHLAKWLRFDASEMLHQVSSHVLDLEIYSDSGSEIPIEATGDKKTLLVVMSNSNDLRTRFRRSTNNLECDEGLTYCCKKDYTVNFEDIGYHFVIQPKSFKADICKGACSSTKTNNFYKQIMTQMLTIKTEIEGVTNVIHCQPTSYNRLYMMYIDNDGDVKSKFFDNTSVATCGCS